MSQQTARKRRRLLTDFATLYAHMWHRDFPLQPGSPTNARRADWTTHIGITVRSAADLMGWVTHFESGGKTDAVLRDNRSQAVAPLEWEWHAMNKEPEINEFRKLKDFCGKEENRQTAFAALIGYAKHTPAATSPINYTQRWKQTLDDYTQRWTTGLPPLLLVTVHFVWTGKYRHFNRMTFHKLEGGKKRRLRVQPAYPWNVQGSKWQQ